MEEPDRVDNVWLLLESWELEESSDGECALPRFGWWKLEVAREAESAEMRGWEGEGVWLAAEIGVGVKFLMATDEPVTGLTIPAEELRSFDRVGERAEREACLPRST